MLAVDTATIHIFHVVFLSHEETLFFLERPIPEDCNGKVQTSKRSTDVFNLKKLRNDRKYLGIRP